MADKLLDTADALVAAVTAYDFGDDAPDFTAIRTYRPITVLQTEQSDRLSIRVVPVDDEQAGKAAVQSDMLLRVFIQCKLPDRTIANAAEPEAADDAAIDTYMAFVADLQTLLLLTPLVVGGINVWAYKADRKPACDMEEVEGRRFLACIETYYRAIWS